MVDFFQWTEKKKVSLAIFWQIYDQRLEYMAKKKWLISWRKNVSSQLLTTR